MTDSGGRNVGTTATTSVDTPLSVGAPWRRADIQGLRALAVLAVIAFHADLPVPGGFTGVDIFFVISGYVITLLLLRQHAKGRISLATFYARRTQRLLPALAVMVVIVFVLSWLIESPFGAQQATAATGIGAMLLVANIVIIRSTGDYFASAAESNPLLNTWSLSVEEQFYLVFPLVVVIALTRVHRRYGLFVIVATVTAVSFVVSLALTFGWSPLGVTNQPQTWAFYLSPTRAWEFGAGALLAIAIARHSWRPTPAQSRILAWLGAGLVAASLWSINPKMPFPGIAALLPVLGTTALIAAGLRSNPITRALSARPWVLVGDASYSLYLWHWPVIVLAIAVWPGPFTPVLAAVASIVPAVISYRYLENPIRNRKMKQRTVVIGGLAVTTSVVVFGWVLMTFGTRTIPEIQDLNTQRQQQVASELAGCFVFGTYTPEDTADCWFRTPNADGWVLLAGDSHAAHLSDAVVSVAQNRSLDVYSVTGGKCPFTVAPTGITDVTNCDELNRALMDRVESPDPPVAVVMGDKGVPAGFAQTVLGLEDRGIPVIWVRDVPRWAPVARRIQNLPCTGGAFTFTCTFDREVVDGFSRENRALEQQALAGLPNVIAVDPWPLFCAGDKCSPIQEGQLQYVDNEHLNAGGSQRLAPLIDEALSQALS